MTQQHKLETIYYVTDDGKNKIGVSASHLGARALLPSHGVYRYCPKVNDDPVVAVFAERDDFPGPVSFPLLDTEQSVDGRRTAFCANILNSNNFVPPTLPGPANAANPPAAAVRVGLLVSTVRLGVSLEETAEETTTLCLAVSNTGAADVTTVFALLLGFDLPFTEKSVRFDRFGVLILTADDGRGRRLAGDGGDWLAC